MQDALGSESNQNPLNPFNPMFKIKSPMMNDVRIVSHLSPIFVS